MNTLKRLILCIVILATVTPVFAEQPDERTHRYTPSAEEMIVDGLIYRPLSLAGTIIGTGIYIVTLPFSLMGDNEGQARERLIIAPANSTFNRCLGCLDNFYERNLRYEQNRVK